MSALLFNTLLKYLDNLFYVWNIAVRKNTLLSGGSYSMSLLVKKRIADQPGLR